MLLSQSRKGKESLHKIKSLLIFVQPPKHWQTTHIRGLETQYLRNRFILGFINTVLRESTKTIIWPVACLPFLAYLMFPHITYFPHASQSSNLFLWVSMSFFYYLVLCVIDIENRIVGTGAQEEGLWSSGPQWPIQFNYSPISTYSTTSSLTTSSLTTSSFTISSFLSISK